MIFQRLKPAHPSQGTLQQNNVVQALDCIASVQHKHKIQPVILDYSNGELMVVDANFLVFLETHSEEELLEYIGIGDFRGAGQRRCGRVGSDRAF